MAKFDVIEREIWGKIRTQKNKKSSKTSFKNRSRIFTTGFRYTFPWLRVALDVLMKHLKESGHLKSKFVGLPAFICPIVPEILIRNGLESILIDVNENDFTLDIRELRKIGNRKIGAFILVHTFGFPMDIEFFHNHHPDAILIEDAAHAWGARWNDTMIGTAGDYSLFSFYKQMGNPEGGLLWSKKNDLEKMYKNLPEVHHPFQHFARTLWKTEGWHQIFFDILRRNRPFDDPESPQEMDWKSERGSDKELKFLEDRWTQFEQEQERRRELVPIYKKHFNPQLVEFQESVSKQAMPVYPMVSIRLNSGHEEKRNALVGALRKQGIFVDRLWHNAAGVLPEYERHRLGSCPVTKRLADSILNLPIKGHYTEEDIRELAEKFEKCLKTI